MHHAGKQPLPLYELPWGPRLHNFAPLHHENPIVIGDSVQSVGDCDDGGVLEFCFYALLDEMVGLDVGVWGCLVEDEKGVILEEGSSEA